MKKLATLLTVAALAVGMTMSAVAQQPGPRGGDGKAGAPGQRGPGRVMGRMAEFEKDILAKLNLNADQKKKIEALNKKTKTKMDALMKAPGEMKDKRDKFREINKTRRDEMNKILTPAQQKKYQELWQAKVKELRPSRPGGPGGPMPPKGGAAKAGNKGKA